MLPLLSLLLQLGLWLGLALLPLLQAQVRLEGVSRKGRTSLDHYQRKGMRSCGDDQKSMEIIVWMEHRLQK
ncbi:hypothetical protein BCR41DRAFT_346590 [Lobosporangium transversale]|uniref:Uncharacterized protein n=1 Tax=Lobosporangium transversale TaxID=64571 RepID=A0A1Y2GYD8_9FUNG|nr:hypothetical protein BCR41DRAFT_346590 [Lobosporangium transversale]ORZ27275.1 hypothetical protein BCR41DRAFT_346590 [Lobosporangium transversale]|eukprot:XP_021885002.1 hypothetical protein BCR41DRAFT_346590 [Lobosporangium transversale]